MIKQLLIPTLVTGTLMVGTTPAQAATVILDDFTDVIGSYQFVMPGMMDDSTQTGLNVLGGSRTLDINVESGTAGIGVLPGTGLVWDNGDAAKSSASVLWDSDGVGLDANFSKQLGLSIMVAELDLDAEIKFTLTDSTGNESSLSRSGLNPNTTESFLFQDFTKDSNFNYKDIQSVLLSLSGPEAVDATFQSIKFIPGPPTISSVPEPNTMLGILAVGGASLLVGRRQKLK